MTYTRRRFLETTGALAAAPASGRSVGFAQQSPAGSRQAGAPGVELNVDDAALPDYSRDLERYLVRLANEARDRRKQIINAISTRQGVLDRQKTVVSGALEDARRSARSHAAQRARDRHRRAAWLSNREGDVREPAATLRHGEPLCAGRNRTPSGDSRTARAFGERQGVAQLSEAVHESRAQGLRRPRLRPVRSGRTHRVPGKPARPVRTRRWNERARVRRPPPHPARRQLRPVPRVGRHPRASTTC